MRVTVTVAGVEAGEHFEKLRAARCARPSPSRKTSSALAAKCAIRDRTVEPPGRSKPGEARTMRQNIASDLRGR